MGVPPTSAFCCLPRETSTESLRQPGSRYVRHRLSVSELYVQARLAERTGQLEVLTFDTEPECWRVFSGRLGGQTVLKPDAFVLKFAHAIFPNGW